MNKHPMSTSKHYELTSILNIYKIQFTSVRFNYESVRNGRYLITPSDFHNRSTTTTLTSNNFAPKDDQN